ncbi:hypothetical protein SDC9_169029 [bioreactor metagenome]|uniref:Uncharacterized protein n=1 Tax=bioreactor metagenome TaxID=1076179 RepID=A0A645G779_9ZZZZ
MTAYAGEKGVLFGYEQMYTPTQGLWTINLGEEYLKTIYARAGQPMYLTIDTAHQFAQRLFLKPLPGELKTMIEARNTCGKRLPDAVEKAVLRGEKLSTVLDLMEGYGYWFAQSRDSDVYEWLGELGCYSPIIHLQQTDGTFSAHRPFTKVNNKNGIVAPREVLRAIKKSYDKQGGEGLPPKAADIYMAFELFFGVSVSAGQILEDMKESVQYWRKTIPEDGLPLDQLV